MTDEKTPEIPDGFVLLGTARVRPDAIAAYYHSQTGQTRVMLTSGGDYWTDVETAEIDDALREHDEQRVRDFQRQFGGNGMIRTQPC